MAEEKQKRNWLFAVPVFVMLSLAYGCYYLVATQEDPDIVDECSAIATQMESKISLPASVSTPGRPAFFCEKGVHSPLFIPDDGVDVYGVTDGTKQDAILAALARAKQRLRTKRIVVSFYEKENWITWSDPNTGRHGGDRGPEKLIRKAVIP